MSQRFTVPPRRSQAKRLADATVLAAVAGLTAAADSDASSGPAKRSKHSAVEGAAGATLHLNQHAAANSSATPAAVAAVSSVTVVTSATVAAAATRAERAAQPHLDRLADVELQCILQWLDPKSIWLASASCVRFSQQSDRPFVWRRFAAASAPDRACLERFGLVPTRDVESRWPHCPRLRRFVPCKASIGNVRNAEEFKAALASLTSYGRIVELESCDNSRVRVEDLLALFRAPCLQRVSHVHLSLSVSHVHLSSGGTANESVLRAVCAMPALQWLTMDWTDAARRNVGAPSNVRVLSAAALATAALLRRVDLVTTLGTASSYAALQAIPRLETLMLSRADTLREHQPVATLFGLGNLKRLELRDFLDSHITENLEETFRSLLGQLSALQHFSLRSRHFPALARALMAVGVTLLPNLQHVRWSDSRGPSKSAVVDKVLLWRLLRAWPPSQLRVCQGDSSGSNGSVGRDCCSSVSDKCKWRYPVT